MDFIRSLHTRLDNEASNDFLEVVNWGYQYANRYAYPDYCILEIVCKTWIKYTSQKPSHKDIVSAILLSDELCGLSPADRVWLAQDLCNELGIV